MSSRSENNIENLCGLALWLSASSKGASSDCGVPGLSAGDSDFARTGECCGKSDPRISMKPDAGS